MRSSPTRRQRAQPVNLTRPGARSAVAELTGTASTPIRIRDAVGADAVEVLIYSEIDASGWWGISAEAFARDLAPYAGRSLRVRVNSPGGDVFDGVAIYNTLLQHDGEVEVVVEGVAASAASFIALAGDRLVMMRSATMMIHDASTIVWGNAADLVEVAAVLDQVSTTIADMYTRRAGGTVDEWRARMRAETWFTAAQAVDIGLADEVGDPVRGTPTTEPADPAARVESAPAVSAAPADALTPAEMLARALTTAAGLPGAATRRDTPA